MSNPKQGNTVKVHYTGKLVDGTVFDSSENREPLEFSIGSQQVIPGFENAVAGLKIGESTTVTIPSNEAYGEYRNDLLFDVPKENFPSDATLEVGMMFQMQNDQGQPVPVSISEVKETTVVIDANHQLAGKDLIFDLKLVDICEGKSSGSDCGCSCGC